MDDVQTHEEYIRQKHTKVEAVCAKDSHAAVLYVQCMLPCQIKK